MQLAKLTAALVAAGLALPALAASDSAMLQKLMERMERLEARNAELEKEVKELKGENTKVAQSLDSPRLSEDEPELTVRLKAVEKDQLNMKKAQKIAEALDGIKVGASLATVGQKAYGLPDGLENGPSQLNYRADVSVELPLKPVGDIDHKLFAHLRMGQGLGLNAAFSNLGHFASAPNALAFRASGASPDDSVTILGQAWYQASIPLPFLGFKPYSRETLELTFGKMDIFGFFDQNKGGGDESKQFLNSVFVHNPLLDAGGEVGVDANGFQPGFVASYLNWFDKPQPWRISIGLFGAGDRGSNYQRSLSSPLLMVQAEKQMRFDGLLGNYRIYGWNRSQGTDWDGNQSKHTGIGVSIDQRIGDGITVFGRYGKMIKGELPFNQAATVGAEFSGGYWNRGADAIGIASAWLQSGKGYRTTPQNAWLDDAHTMAAYAFTPQGAEKVTEIYYRYRLSPQFELSPDFQYVTNGGGNADAKSVKVFAVRANIAY
ncbi:carbohydrate porin [Dechloromonas sp. XY25]|uniref:Carbohydrate porin n=1 Tax=Dechloromonas hankyongensis TaxID=2908002 RepID=A0ABS9K7H2_9RHOO|nr:carbohydrate porin [Dechloromonas hankyongensis]MCG2579101.1 carbohydrate porin [Dechloromonas hankyongensis]